MGGVPTKPSGRARGARKARIILGLVGGGILVALAVWIQESWRLSPTVSWLVTRSASSSRGPDSGKAHVRALPRSTDPGSSPVLITEVSAANRDVIVDDDLAPSDWIELFNRSDQPTPLAGWRLVESGRPRRGWVFPEITIAPRSYLIVWASGKDRVSGAASRRVNTQLTRQTRPYHIVNDFHTPLPGGFWRTRQARRVDVDVVVPGSGRYTLWMKASAEGLSGTVRVRVQGSPSIRVTVPGGRARNVMVGAEGGMWIEGAGGRTVTIASRTGTIDVMHLALVRARGGDDAPGDDRYGRHVHASFRLGHGHEGVMLVDPVGAVRDEATARDHPGTLTLQREPGALGWRVALPTPAGRAFHPAPDLSGYPSLSPDPLEIAPALPPGVEEIRYTVDGAVPTTAAPRLEGAIWLARPTALRLRGYSGAEPVTAIVSRQFWIGSPPAAPTLMLALDPNLITDPEIGIEHNDRWRRQQELPDDPALGPLRVTRRRHWARERRQWIKSAHLLALDHAGLLFDGRARVRRFTMAVGPGFGLHVRTRDPIRPGRDVFGRTIPEPGRSIIVEEDALNIPAYDAVRAAGGVAPLTRWGRLAVNGEPPSWRVLLEPVDEDLLQSRWGHARFDVLKGKPFAAKRGTTAAYEVLARRLDQGGALATDLAPLIDLDDLTALHFTALFLATGENDEVWQAYFLVDHDRVPPLIHAVGWDLDHAIQEGPEYDALAVQQAYARSGVERDTYLGVRVMLALLDNDPAFRQSYLRYAERMMNHVLTPSWWEASRRAAGGPVDPARAEEVARFIRERPAHFSRSLARGLGLPPPHVVGVRVQGPGGVTIDGYAHRGPYLGHYFAGGPLELDVPPEGRGTFRHFTVNGRRASGPALRLPVTEDLEIVARFGG